MDATELAQRLERGHEQITARERARGAAPATWVAAWLGLLAQYEAAVDEARGTCRRRDHVGAQLDARQARASRWVEQRLAGVR